MITNVVIEGVDRVGKNSIGSYIDRLSNRLLPIGNRNVLSTIVYAKKYGRDIDPDYLECMINNYKNSGTLTILLIADVNDLKLRGEITGEQDVDYNMDQQMFMEEASMLLSDYNISLLMYNTTVLTPYKIATDIVKYVKEQNDMEIKEMRGE